MQRSRDGLERFLTAATGGLRQLAWLLTGDPVRAGALLRDALARAYVSAPDSTDRERAAAARQALVRDFLRSAAPPPAVAFGLAPLPSAPDWAIAAMVHGCGLSPEAAADATRRSRGSVVESARRSAAHAARLRTLDAPASVERPDADRVLAAAEPLLVAARRRRRRVAAAALAVLLALGGIGVLAPQLTRVDGQAVSISNPEQTGAGVAEQEWPYVETTADVPERLELQVSGNEITLSLPAPPSRVSRTIVRGPTDPGDAVQGQLRGMPFYVVRGRVEQSWVTFGPTVADASDRSVQVVPAGGWSVLWPQQASLAATTRAPVGVLWRTAEGDRRVSPLAGSYPRTERMRVTGREGDGSGLLMADGASLMLLTWYGSESIPIKSGRALLAPDLSSSLIFYTAVGYGRVTRASAPGRLDIRLRRNPGSLLYTVSVRAPSGSPLPPRVPVTLYDDDRVVGRADLLAPR